MGKIDPDWKEKRLRELGESSPATDEDVRVIEEGDESTKNAFLQNFRMIYRSVDLATLDNGISAAQLGAIAGTVRAALNQSDSILGTMQANLEKVREGIKAISAEKPGIIGGVPVNLQEAAKAEVEMLEAMGPALEEFIEELRIKLQAKPRMEEAITNCVNDACLAGGDEAARFLGAFTKAIVSPTIDGEGMMVSANTKTARIYNALLILGDNVKLLAHSVPELHRLLVVWINNEGILTSDEESLEWNEDRKCIEGVCRKLELSLRAPGRPAKTIPNQK